MDQEKKLKSFRLALKTFFMTLKFLCYNGKAKRLTKEENNDKKIYVLVP